MTKGILIGLLVIAGCGGQSDVSERRSSGQPDGVLNVTTGEADGVAGESRNGAEFGVSTVAAGAVAECRGKCNGPCANCEDLCAFDAEPPTFYCCDYDLCRAETFPCSSVCAETAFEVVTLERASFWYPECSGECRFDVGWGNEGRRVTLVARSESRDSPRVAQARFRDAGRIAVGEALSRVTLETLLEQANSPCPANFGNAGREGTCEGDSYGVDLSLAGAPASLSYRQPTEAFASLHAAVSRVFHALSGCFNDGWVVIEGECEPAENDLAQD